MASPNITEDLPEIVEFKKITKELLDLELVIAKILAGKIDQ
jgi:hypothetical protein